MALGGTDCLKSFLKKTPFCQAEEKGEGKELTDHSGLTVKTKKKFTGAKIGAIFCKITSRITTKNLKIGP